MMGNPRLCQHKRCYCCTTCTHACMNTKRVSRIFFTGKSLGPPDEGHEGQNAAVRHEQKEVQNASAHMGRCTWFHAECPAGHLPAERRDKSLLDCASGLWAVDELTKNEDRNVPRALTVLERLVCYYIYPCYRGPGAAVASVV